jgi:hypothetical protein
MWTTGNRYRYSRDKLRYPSDLTDDEWSQVAPLIPPAKRGGRRREVDVREVLNGIMYVLSSTFGNFRAARDYVAVQKMSSAAMNSRARSIDRTARPRGPPAIHRSFQSDQ